MISLNVHRKSPCNVADDQFHKCVMKRHDGFNYVVLWLVIITSVFLQPTNTQQMISNKYNTRHELSGTVWFIHATVRMVPDWRESENGGKPPNYHLLHLSHSLEFMTGPCFSLGNPRVTSGQTERPPSRPMTRAQLISMLKNWPLPTPSHVTAPGCPSFFQTQSSLVGLTDPCFPSATFHSYLFI